MNNSSTPGNHPDIDNALSAFQVGLNNLFIQHGHWNADYQSIIKSNLRLLHQTLMQVPEYRGQIKRLLHHSHLVNDTRAFKTAHSLLQKFQRNTVTVPLSTPGHSNAAFLAQRQSDNNPAISSRIRAHLMCVPAGHRFYLGKPGPGIRLYMPVIGKIRIQGDPVETSIAGQLPWWRRLKSACHTQSLKNGDLLLYSADQDAGKTLSADNNACVLLCITVAISTPQTLPISSFFMPSHQQNDLAMVARALN